jgi:hypothetical protein
MQIPAVPSKRSTHHKILTIRQLLPQANHTFEMANRRLILLMSSSTSFKAALRPAYQFVTQGDMPMLSTNILGICLSECVTTSSIDTHPFADVSSAANLLAQSFNTIAVSRSLALPVAVAIKVSASTDCLRRFLSHETDTTCDLRLAMAMSAAAEVASTVGVDVRSIITL